MKILITMRMVPLVTSQWLISDQMRSKGRRIFWICVTLRRLIFHSTYCVVMKG